MPMSGWSDKFARPSLSERATIFSMDCSIKKTEDDTRVCALHNKPLIEQSMEGNNPPGIGHMKAWVCLVSKKTLMEVEGF